MFLITTDNIKYKLIHINFDETKGELIIRHFYGQARSRDYILEGIENFNERKKNNNYLRLLGVNTYGTKTPRGV